MKITQISDRGLVRLVPAAYHKPPVLRGLVESDEEMEILAQIEGMTSARLLAERGRNLYLDRRRDQPTKIAGGWLRGAFARHGADGGHPAADGNWQRRSPGPVQPACRSGRAPFAVGFATGPEVALMARGVRARLHRR